MNPGFIVQTFRDIAREIFPDADNDFLGYVIWNETGFPCYWDGDPETCFRRQLQEYKDTKISWLDRVKP